MLKLYSGIVISNILDRYLVIDTDTFFLKPTTFIMNNKCLYNFGTEYYKGYFDHMKKLNKNFEKIIDKSGICHHMIFETKYIKEIIEIVENNHNDKFYNVFLKTFHANSTLRSGKNPRTQLDHRKLPKLMEHTTTQSSLINLHFIHNFKK